MGSELTCVESSILGGGRGWEKLGGGGKPKARERERGKIGGPSFLSPLPPPPAPSFTHPRPPP